MNAKKNILVLHHFPHLGGAENYLLAAFKSLSENYNVFFICQEDGAFTKAAREAGVRVSILKLRGWRKLKYALANFFTIRRIVRFCRDNDIHVIASGYYRVTPYAVKAARAVKIPCVSFIQDIASVETMRRFLVFQCSQLIAVSSFVAKNIKNSFSGQVHIIHNAIAVDGFNATDKRMQPFRVEAGISPEEKVVGMVAHFVPLKGHDVFLKAFKMISETFKNTTAVIVGTDLYKHVMSAADIKQEAEKLGLTDKVIFAGERHDIARVLHSLDVYILASAKEGFGRGAMEAMAAGVAVVSTDCGGPRDLIEDGISGLLVPVGDYEKMAEATLSLLRDNAKRAQIAEAGKTRVKSYFNVECFNQKVLSVFDGLVQGDMPC